MACWRGRGDATGELVVLELEVVEEVLNYWD
jgi:hypothetical protein